MGLISRVSSRTYRDVSQKKMASVTAFNPENLTLSVSQENLFDEINRLVSEEPLPSELPLDDPVLASQQSTKALILPDSDLEVLNAHLDESSSHLSTTRNFYKWFSTLEDEISNVQLEEANAYLNTLQSYQK